MTPPVTLCIVNYNGERYLPRTLEAVRGSGLRFDEVLLVDDASPDRSVSLVRESWPEVRVLSQPGNGGPGAARNAGYAAARNDLILFIDNDVALTPECAERLREALLERDGAAVAMPRVLYAARPDIIQYEGADCHFLGLMALRRADHPATEAPAEVAETQSVVTCAFLVHRGRWGADPPFDESFIFNYEDHDFGVRTRIMGHTILAVADARVLHGQGTAGLSFREGGKRSPIRVYCLIRNRWRILLQSFQLRSLVLLAPCLLIYEAVQIVGVVKKGWLGPWLRSVGWILTNPGTLRERRRAVQRSRRTPDRAVLVGGPLPFTPGLAPGGLERMVRNGLDRFVAWYWRMVRGRL
ncbi:MAG TPA: glycosyltransferase [Gemmatimonadales bacterium]|nr:glycosyltransferase [Gemmatimonadales bacterium]